MSEDLTSAKDKIKIENIKTLLNEASLIYKKYEQIAKITGENFNIFQTLGLESAETKHSKIIAELLNPKGSHDMGNEFLKLFLEITNEDFQKFENSSVEIEKTTIDGRIDIFIAGNQETIAIENKIYAGDQPSQLARYSKHSTKLIYLTLYGDKPSDYSTNKDEDTIKKLKLMSYEKDIINWLERCKEKSVNFSYLRETIAQYINLLKFLTGQTRRKEMSNEIVDIAVKSLDNVKAAFAIAENADEIKRKIVLKHFVPAMEKLAQKHNLKLDPYPYDNDCLKRYWKLPLYNDLLQKNCIRICFEFQDGNLGRLFYGFRIWVEDSKMKEVYKEKNSLRDSIKAIGKKPGESYWIFCDQLYDHWHREELANLVVLKSPVIEECEKKIEYLMDLIEKAQKWEM
ncbi:MAG: PD-(D/E)XK nuclease family protein [Fibromonadaceae bacterium]|jgi:hypothetical protein|nr:PD-(D/E)XK nuclease family protein [Fibromonadaceae bacterium]